MPLYLASYDIREQNRNEYQELWDYLDSLKAVRILFSEYAIPFDGKTLELATIISKHLKPDDRLLVCELFCGEASAFLNLKIAEAAYQKLLTDFARVLQ
jgi:hypothetical protein